MEGGRCLGGPGLASVCLLGKDVSLNCAGSYNSSR